MPIKKIVEDIFLSECDVIIHQCNCHCRMGSGIAKEIKRRWPEVYEADKKTGAGDRTKLGKILPVPLTGQPWSGEEEEWSYCINCYSQFDYGKGPRQTDYEAYYTCLKKVEAWLSGRGLNLAAPLNMGCALAGGDWEICYSMFKSVFTDSDVNLTICEHPDKNISHKVAKQN